MLRSLHIPLPVSGGEVNFRIGQVALIDERLAQLWIRRGVAEQILSFDNLRDNELERRG